MAQVTQKIILLSQISESRQFVSRYLLKDDALSASVAQRGVLQPLMVYQKSGESQYTLIAGHKRREIAATLNLEQVPVWEMEGILSDEELFLIAVCSNWNQCFQEIDIAYTLHQAVRGFHLSESTVFEEVFPALGFTADKKLLKQSLQVFELEKEVLESVARGHLSMRAAMALKCFNVVDQRCFVAEIGRRIKLSTNQQIQTSEWLFDLLKANNLSLEAFLSKEVPRTILRRPHDDQRQKADQWMTYLYAARFPDRARKEKAFQVLSRQMKREFPLIDFKAPQYFEDAGFYAHIHLKRPDSLKDVLRALQNKKTLLNSLFDIML